ncbi:proline rich transmembrane protein 1B [Alosa sapidissima]|uniref:proline rich transmembrane protein 1B n=1 Tax=Alosa sapidissima TaxID=34773 RepID=UPI001C09BB56|nr:proline rich transmembrane protein 1B [Alosa sapidissima]
MDPDPTPPPAAPGPLLGVGSAPQGVIEPEDFLRSRPQLNPSPRPCPAHESEHVQTACPVLDTDSIQTSGTANDSESLRTAHSMIDSESLQTAHSMNDSENQRAVHSLTDTDSFQVAHALTDADSLHHVHRPYDTESNLTNQLTYDSASNQTINPSSDTDSNQTIHPPYPPPYPPHTHTHLPDRRLVDDCVAGGAQGDAPTTIHAPDLPHASEDPPPYSPPDPKLTYLIYPPPHYSGQAVMACQPTPNSPGFFQPQFMPSASYPPYAIYMNGSSLGEDQPPLPKDYLVESLLVTIFCCLMSGLVALMYSYETRAALARGDIRGGERASQKARLLVMFSLMFGVFVCVGWIIYAVIALCV